MGQYEEGHSLSPSVSVFGGLLARHAGKVCLIFLSVYYEQLAFSHFKIYLIEQLGYSMAKYVLSILK